MTDVDNAAGIYLPPGATAEDDNKVTEFLGLDDDDDDKDLLNIEDDLDQLLSDVITKPKKPAHKPKPSPTKKPVLSTKPSPLTDKPTPAQRPMPAARAGPGKTPPKPAPRKGKMPPKEESEGAEEKTRSRGENVATMDDGDILKYIQENAADDEASLDLF